MPFFKVVVKHRIIKEKKIPRKKRKIHRARQRWVINKQK